MSETPEIKLPAYLKDITDDTAKNMISVSGSVPRISIRGRQFRLIKDGEEISKTGDPIHVIIIGVVPEVHMAKTFYINGYQPGSTDPPDCSSFFGEVPDSWITSPQSTNCRNCAQNKWGSATSMSGKKAKACKDSKRLMVIMAADAKEENPTVYIFNVTIASLKALSEYGKFLLSHNLPMAAVVTQIEFVDSDFPQVDFVYKAILSAAIGKPMLERAQRKEWMDNKDLIALPEAPEPADRPQLAAPNQQNARPAQAQPTHADMPAGDVLDQW